MRKLRKGESYGRTDRPIFTSNNTYKSAKSACLNRLEDERLKHSKNARTSCLLPRICSKSALIAVLSGVGFREQKNRIAKVLDVVVFNVYKNMAFSHKKGLVQLSGEQYCQEPPTRNILFTSNNIYKSPKSACLNRPEDERLKHSKNARTSCSIPRIRSKSALIAVLSGVEFREQKNRIAKVLDVVVFNVYKSMAFSHKKGLVQLSGEQSSQEPPTRNILFTSNNTYKSPKSACLNRREDERLKHSKNARTSCLLPRICSKSALIAVLSGVGFREQKNRIAKVLDVVVFNAYKNMAFSHKKGLVQLSGEQYCQEQPTRNILFTSNNTYKSPKSACLNRLEDERLKHSENARTSCLLPRICSKSALIAVLSGVGFREQKNRIAKVLDVVVFNVYKNMAFSHKKGLVQLSGEQRCQEPPTPNILFTSNNTYKSAKSACLNRLEDERLKHSKNARTSCLLPRICSKSALIAVLNGVGFREQKNRIAKVLDVVVLNVYKNMAFSHKKGLVQLSGEQYCQEPPTRNILDSLKPTAYSLLLIFVSMFSLSDAWAQSVEIRTAERQNISHIKGKIKSKYTNVPIEGACVKLIGGSETAFSNREGDFTISTIKAEGQLQVSVSGYENALVAFSEGRLDNSKSTIHLVKILKQSDAFSVGDNLPEHWWREQFNVFNHPFSRSKVTLLEYREPELFILDFWAPWCKPCIAAIDEWQQFLNENSVADIAVLAVNVGLYDRSEIFMHKRGWNIPSLYGEETLALSRQFFSEDQVGGQVWILNGKVVFIGHKRDRVKEMERLNMILGSIKEGRQK